MIKLEKKLRHWVDGWMDVEAGLRIAYSNQKITIEILMLLVEDFKPCFFRISLVWIWKHTSTENKNEPNINGPANLPKLT